MLEHIAAQLGGLVNKAWAAAAVDSVFTVCAKGSFFARKSRHCPRAYNVKTSFIILRSFESSYYIPVHGS
jgi:hypothetical protein